MGGALTLMATNIKTLWNTGRLSWSNLKNMNDDFMLGMMQEMSSLVMTPPMVGSTWPRVHLTLESDCLPALFQGTASFRLVMD